MTTKVHSACNSNPHRPRANEIGNGTWSTLRESCFVSISPPVIVQQSSSRGNFALNFETSPARRWLCQYFPHPVCNTRNFNDGEQEDHRTWRHRRRCCPGLHGPWQGWSVEVSCRSSSYTFRSYIPSNPSFLFV